MTGNGAIYAAITVFCRNSQIYNTIQYNSQSKDINTSSQSQFSRKNKTKTSKVVSLASVYPWHYSTVSFNAVLANFPVCTVVIFPVPVTVTLSESLSSPLLSPLLMFPTPESDLAWWSPQPSALAWLGLGQSCRSQVFISLELELLLREETVTFIPPHHIPPALMSCQKRSGHISKNIIQGRIELCRNMYPMQYFSNNQINTML